MAALEQLEQVFNNLWESECPPITAELMRALNHSGGYVAGAFEEEDLVGGAVAFLGRDHNGAPLLHSHMLGVLRGTAGGGLGYQLKQHQRQWALARDIPLITWTFDPLVRRNAHFNLAKLGADAAVYEVNFYGAMDGINADDESDRLVMHWHVSSPRAEAAAQAGLPALDIEELLARGASPILIDQRGEPRTSASRAPVVACQVPQDIIDLRRTDPACALRWRHALRDALVSSLAEGRHITGFTRSGWYVLEPQGD